MNRRQLLAAVPLAALSGCLTRTVGSRPGATGPGSTGGGESPSPTTRPDADDTVRLTANGASARFQVLDGHRPTEEKAAARFGPDRVVVSGTTDPPGCDRPTLASLEYDAAAGTVGITVGGHPRFGETATVECGNASFDYRCLIATERGRPNRVTVRHDYEDGPQWSTTQSR